MPSCALIAPAVPVRYDAPTWNGIEPAVAINWPLYPPSLEPRRRKRLIRQIAAAVLRGAHGEFVEGDRCPHR